MSRFSDAWSVLRGTATTTKLSAKNTRAATSRGRNRPRAGLAAERPTYQAAPILPSIQLRTSLGQRSNNRMRSLVAMLKEARDFNAYVADAVDNFITLANPGYDMAVYFANKAGDDGEPQADVEGLRLVQQFATRMFSEYSGAWDEIAGANSTYPGLDAFINMIHLTVATQGGMAAEVQLTESLDDIVDVYPVDPAIVDFQVDPDTQRLVPGIRLQGPFKALDPIRFRYVGKNPDPFQPAGRSPLLAVLDTVFFQQQFMRELQAIAHVANAPRMDIKIIEETVVAALKETRPDLTQAGNEDEFQAYLDGYLADIEKVINDLEADDAFVHYDSVEANFITPKGVAIPVGDLMGAIDKMMVAGVKQLPLLLGLNEGATTTHATVQWQVFIQKLKGFQQISIALAQWALNLYLRVQGRQSYAVVKYVEHKTSDALLDAQALNINVQSYSEMVDRGWMTDDEASVEVTGHEATGTPKPPPPPPPAEPPISTPPRSVGMHDPKVKVAIRAVGDVVNDMPPWLQTAHHETARNYESWRGGSIVPKFSSAAHALHANGSAIQNMTTSQARDWLHNKLSLDQNDKQRLNNTLREAGRRTTRLTLEEQLRQIQKPQSVQITNRQVLRGIDDLARDNAKSIVETYNDELKAQIESHVQPPSRAIADDIITTLRSAIESLSVWELLRNAWKSAQVALHETQTTVVNAVAEFFGRNEISGQAEVYPYSSTQDICADYIDANPYPDMQTLLDETDLPAHVNCPHYGRLVDGGTYTGSGAIWVGGD